MDKKFEFLYRWMSRMDIQGLHLQNLEMQIIHLTEAIRKGDFFKTQDLLREITKSHVEASDERVVLYRTSEATFSYLRCSDGRPEHLKACMTLRQLGVIQNVVLFWGKKAPLNESSH